jgi:aminoglycoside phosphotransferase family enzyme
MNEKEVQILNEAGTFRNLPVKGTVEETHISWVIVGKSHVFKIKKPLKLSFLDFSTLSQRKKYCERELHLNRRFSPIYLNVLPVRTGNGKWSIGGDKEKVVDYVVHMKRLISAKRMDKLLQTRKVNLKHIRSLSNVISSFHSDAEKIWKPFQLEKASADFNDIDSITSLARKHLGSEAAAVIRKSIRWSDAFLKAHANRIKERIENGFCRDVHGDLHSGNIFLYEKPILFDCVEFNDSYSQIDLINEIAFFCMDLEAYGRRDLSKLFTKEYQRHLNCFQTKVDQRLMTYYKCFRANVRAKVHALSADQASAEKKTFQLHLQAFRKYVQLMKTYMT